MVLITHPWLLRLVRFLLWFTLESEADLQMPGVKTTHVKSISIGIAIWKFTCSNSQLHLTRKTSLDCCHCRCLYCSVYLPDFQELSLLPPPTIPGVVNQRVALYKFFFTPDISEGLTSVCPTCAHSLSVDPVKNEAWGKGRKRGILDYKKLLV